MVKINTKEKYKARFAKRGARKMKLVRHSDHFGFMDAVDGHDLSFRSKPRHELRFANIADCWPLLGRKDFVPVGHVHHGYPAGHGH
jgi:hypothetical protein